MRAPSSLLAGIALAAVAIVGTQQACAQSPDMTRENSNSVSYVKHPDGAYSVYRRGLNEEGKREMVSKTYTSKGELASRNVYFTGKYGHLTACHIFDNKNNLLYKVSYGYDKKARLIEERMFDANAKNEDGSPKVVQRVLYYYDSSGNRSKPVVVNLNTAIPTIRPTMEDNPYNAAAPKPAARPASTPSSR
ncbi:hypothetical protein [Akkermansia glycaniphila]|uniref:Uncharacterized protein n=1 Tax=Akkermansia glycaniphila TaxID=1679444 RepID=A0A1H6KQB3_9BACT|nr:hypothetical protein [Akkermansia glycaniphila]MBT9448906.1 hypothetical protein [Akkermansia glycaniphila]SEH74061.1 Hypothetical protein PYTT_0368 [Akkermansia glycaniphila]